MASPRKTAVRITEIKSGNANIKPPKNPWLDLYKDANIKPKLVKPKTKNILRNFLDLGFIFLKLFLLMLASYFPAERPEFMQSHLALFFVRRFTVPFVLSLEFVNALAGNGAGDDD